MIALALVGHSPDLLRALASMLAQAAPSVPVTTAGGSAAGSLGTSSPAIEQALAAALAASEDDGVVVLFDLGSAVMALEMALEALPAADRRRILVSRGPLVEGAVAAGVEAAAGASLDRVLAAADAERLAEKLPGDWLAGADR
jgi:dihydroxyacetone kinase DhaKLM complex PTS-EIIA-like component DhaM